MSKIYFPYISEVLAVFVFNNSVVIVIVIVLMIGTTFLNVKYK